MKFIQSLCLSCSCFFYTPVFSQALYQLPDGRTSHVSSFENLNGVPGKGGLTNQTAKGNAFEQLRAGQTKELLNISAGGIIQRIWMTVNDRSPKMLRSLRLRIYWDGASAPAVDVPMGDFFCAALGLPVAFQSALFTNPEGRSFNSYVPMPFRTGARITLTNESATDLTLLFFDIDFVSDAKPPAGMMYFHACWNRSLRSMPGTGMTLLPKVTGTGRFLGVNIGVNVDSAYGKTWWGEGEVKMYIDGDSVFPTVNGTGAEDYIGTGWGEGTYSHLYQGCLMADGKTNRYAFYRFHIPDEIFFYHDMRVTIQEIGGGAAPDVMALQKAGVPLQPVSVSGPKVFTRLLEQPVSGRSLTKYGAGDWVNFYRSDDYSVTAYFYLDKPVDSLAPLAPVAERTR